MNIVEAQEASRASGRVFISYSRRDIAFTQRLAERLKSAGYEAYLDLTDIAPGEPWQERLGKLIAQAHTVVFVLSPDSAASPICGWEVEEAERQGKRLLPVAYRKVEDSIVPPSLARLNFIFMDDPEAFEAQVIPLLNALETDLTWVREHTRLADLANAWEAAGRRSTDTLRGKALEAAERWQSERPAKAPEPTALHRAFLAASRKSATQRQRWAVGGALSVAALATGLGFFAESNRREAEVQSALAVKQRMLAESNERRAVEQERAAQANERRAVEQENIASRNAEEARQQRDAAEQNFRLAKRTLDRVIFRFSQGFKHSEGVRSDVLQGVLAESRSALAELAANSPQDTDIDRIKTVLLREFGDALLNSGDVSAAREVYDEALTTSIHLANRSIDNASDFARVALSFERLGALELRAGNAQSALSAFYKALEITQRPIDGHLLSGRAAGDIGRLRLVLGDAERAAGNSGLAREHYVQSVALLRALISERPRDVKTLQLLGTTLERVADLDMAAGRVVSVRQKELEIYNIVKKITDIEPSNIVYQQNLIASLARLGDRYREDREFDSARDFYIKAIDIAERIVIANSDNIEWRSDLASLNEKVGYIYASKRQFAQAIDEYSKSINVHRQLLKSESSNFEFQRRLSVGLIKLGDVHIDAGDLNVANSIYSESLELARKISLSNPRNTEAQRNVILALERVGDIARLKQDHRKASLAYEEGIALIRRLLQQESDNVVWKRDLVRALSRLASVVPAKESKISYLREARSVVRQLAANRQLTAAERDWPGIADRELAALGVTD